jgi:4'-phosphopantetheinyl transferase
VIRNTEEIIGPDSFSPRQLPLRQLEKPQGDAVHLWHLDFDQLSNPLGSKDAGQSSEFSVFHQRAARRFYLRLLLGAYLGLPGKEVRITRRVKGRPELDSRQSEGQLDFSVARSAGCYLIGISSGAIIGVDLEIEKRRAGRPTAVAKRYFSKAESTALARLDGEQLHRAFMHTWACKEAIVKASGMGIANQLCRFSVETDPGKSPRVLDMQDDDPRAWRLAMARPVAGSIAAIAVRQAGVSLEGFSLT